jgi:hypothetical protein
MENRYFLIAMTPFRLWKISQKRRASRELELPEFVAVTGSSFCA